MPDITSDDRRQPSQPAPFNPRNKDGQWIFDPNVIAKARDIGVRMRNGAALPSGTINPTGGITAQVKTGLLNTKNYLETQIAQAKNNIKEAEALMMNLAPEFRPNNQRNITAYKTNLDALTIRLSVINAQLKPVKYGSNNATDKKPTTTTRVNNSNGKKPPRPTDNRLRYNVGSVEEAYFTSRTEFLLENGNTNTLSSAVKDNKPTPALTSALELWSNGKSSKGMFTTWRDLSSGFDDKSANSQSKGYPGTNEVLPPHAFRFQYNPGSISMSYAGTPLVDPNFEAAGLDKFNLTGTGVTQSTITFQLLINRMYDMKYYVREGENISTGEPNGGFNEPGTLKPGAGEVYGKGVPQPDLETQRAIYNMGTMYDFEFLLRTIMGYTMKSSLRDYSFFEDKGTADMGFLGARPVELHLGKNMRYLGYITNINLEHVIFDNRMVPLFSNVSIAFSRLPDYQGSNLSPQTGEPSVPTNKGGFVGSEDWRRALR
jgi:hypothetical protein